MYGSHDPECTTFFSFNRLGSETYVCENASSPTQRNIVPLGDPIRFLELVLVERVPCFERGYRARERNVPFGNLAWADPER